MVNPESKNNKIEKIPSAVDDCAEVTSKYKRYKEKKERTKRSNFEPINYEKPPHY
jgi:hypothetical protein